MKSTNTPKLRDSNCHLHNIIIQHIAEVIIPLPSNTLLDLEAPGRGSIPKHHGAKIAVPEIESVPYMPINTITR